MLSPEQTELRINRDLALRTHDGLWGHPLCLLLACLTTTIFPDHPAMMSAFVLLFAGQTAIRVGLIRRLEGLRPGSMRVWRATMLWLLMGSGLLWGLLAAWACLVYGFQHPNSYLLLLYHAAISVIGAEMFMHDRRMGQWYMVALFLPPMAVHAAFPERQLWGPLCAFSFYVAFLSVRLKRLCAAYALRLEETRDLEASARRDSLTGLLNRAAMKSQMERELKSATDSGRRVALLFIDLDGFKAINDTCSHRVGDLFLCEIARRLNCFSGLTNRVARLGGDEFTILISDSKLTISRPALMEFARGVLETVCQPHEVEGRRCVVGASVGVGLFPDDATTAEHLVRAADRAMYEAKRTGKGRICSFGAGRTNDHHVPGELGRLEDALSRSRSQGAVLQTGALQAEDLLQEDMHQEALPLKRAVRLRT